MSRESVPTNAPKSDRLTAIRNALLSLMVLLLLAIVAALLVGRRKEPLVTDESTSVAAVETRTQDTPMSVELGDSAHVLPPSSLDPSDVPASAAYEPPPLIPGITLPQIPTNIFANEESLAPAVPGARRGKVRIPISPADEAAILAEDALIPREQFPTGPTASVSLFGSPAAVGRSFVFVIDRSASMGGDGLGAIQAAAKEFQSQLEQLTSEQTFQVVAYNQAADFLTHRELMPATIENKRNLVQFVANLAAYGQTEHVRGLKAALRMKPEVIFLLTDGGDPVLTNAQLHEVRDEVAGRTAIHCLHFGRGPQSEPNNFLSRLAAVNRGNYIYIDMDAH
jgi:hypothetical protein